SWAYRPPSARSGFQEPRELVHVLVEEREHGNRAVAPLLEVLVHQVEIRVTRKEPHLDARVAFDELGHERDVGQTGAAPVLADDEHPARLAETPQDLGVTGPERDFVERVDEALPIDGHVIDVLLQGQPLLEPFFRDHPGTLSRKLGGSSGMKITGVQTLVLNLPMLIDGPTPMLGGRPRTSIDMLLVRIETDGGIVGWGEAFGHRVFRPHAPSSTCCSGLCASAATRARFRRSTTRSSACCTGSDGT